MVPGQEQEHTQAAGLAPRGWIQDAAPGAQGTSHACYSVWASQPPPWALESKPQALGSGTSLCCLSMYSTGWGPWEGDQYRTTRTPKRMLWSPGLHQPCCLEVSGQAATVTSRSQVGRECLPSVPPFLTTWSPLDWWGLVTLAHHGICLSCFIILIQER